MALTVEWFMLHMFPNELFAEGSGSVYLFLMKTAVVIMADIFPSHTENNKQPSVSSVSSLSLVP